MKLIDRDYCVFTKKKDLEHLHTFKQLPVFIGCVDTPLKDDLFSDMSWHISKGTGSLQLSPLIPLEILYLNQHNEVIGKIWQEHHDKFAEFIGKYNVRSVFEIGGAHGALAKNYLELHPETLWTIIDLNPQIEPMKNIKVINGAFNSLFHFKGPFDAVVHSHTLEHMYYPSEFMSDISKFTPEGKYLLFSVPNMLAQLKSYFTNCLNFEHTFFLIEPYIDTLLANNGFEVIEKAYFNEHSIFYAAKKTGKYKSLAYPDLYRQNKALFMDFINYYQGLIKDINSKVKAAQEPVYMFGAHIFSQFLIAFGLNTEKVTCVLDNSPQKTGKRLYGTSLMVDSPKSLKGKGKVNIILKAGIYNEEIKADILKNINPEAVFWE